LIGRLTCQGVQPFTSNIWSGVAPLKIQGFFFFFFMVSSTKSSVCKRLFSQLTPCFIGSSFMLVLCIRDRVLSRSSSRSFNATLLGNYGQKVPYMVEGLLLRSKDYGSASGFDGQHWNMRDSKGKHGTSISSYGIAWSIWLSRNHLIFN
jgi:hypothetical protein